MKRKPDLSVREAVPYYKVSTERQAQSGLGHNLTATAKVKVNAKYVGGVWAYPYKVNISGSLKQGNNTLEVEVINTWENRMIGDHQLPKKERMVESKINSWNGDTTLQKSG